MPKGLVPQSVSGSISIPGGMLEMQISDPTPDLLTRNLHSNKTPKELYAHSSLRGTGLEHLKSFFTRSPLLATKQVWTVSRSELSAQG